MSETRDDMLYEICPLCKGTGKLPKDPQGFARDCYCKPLRVVAVGVTTGQLERMALREIIKAEQRAGYDRASGSLAPVAKPGEAEMLAAENARLRTALEHIARLPETLLAADPVSLHRAPEIAHAAAIARVALLPARPGEAKP